MNNNPDEAYNALFRSYEATNRELADMKARLAKIALIVESWKARCDDNRQLLRGTFISDVQKRINLVAHMTERDRCIRALEPLIDEEEER